MIKLKAVFIVLLLTSNFISAKESTISVVTSFSILEDLVNELGGEHVSVVNLVDRDSDAHMYQPKPSDAVAISKADLVVFNGLEFEGWIARLLKNSNYKNKQIIATKGVKPLTLDGEIDPHAWQSFTNIHMYIKNITSALIDLKPEHADDFTELQKKYVSALNSLESQLMDEFKKIPNDNRIVVTSHDAFGYLGRELDIEFLAPVGVNMEVDASAEDVAKVIDQIREQNVKAIFVENITNPRLLERISAETDVAIGGSLYSDALGEVGGPAGTYFNMMKHNIESLVTAFSTN